MVIVLGTEGEERMSDAAVGTQVVVEREFAHPPEKVWRALTEGPLLEQWLMKNDFAPVVGHRFHFRGEPNPHWDGVVQSEVLELKRPERLVLRWISAGAETVVTWTLRPTPIGVMVRMEQTGFPSTLREANIKGAHYAWQRFVGKLEEVVAKLD
jgi:uncharacterized protein YndB with AHSA1/START domain